jgi:dimeric dUTPase (all-alpha-NTP-PPase superfamily)
MITQPQFKQMVELQRELDAKIYEKQGIEAPPLTRIKANYLVEVGETVNELKGDFKYWSKKSPERQKFVEEFIDAIHFMLSHVYHYADQSHESFDYREGEDRIDYMYRELSKSWLHVITAKVTFDNPRELLSADEMETWQLAYQALTVKSILDSYNYLTLIAKRLGLTEDELQHEYKRKLEINHGRSDSGVY